MLNALFNGRHCIVNRGMVNGSGLEPICHVTEGAEDMRSKIVNLYSRAIQPEEISQRKEVLAVLYNKEDNIRRLLRSIWTDEPLANPMPPSRCR